MTTPLISTPLGVITGDHSHIDTDEGPALTPKITWDKRKQCVSYESPQEGPSSIWESEQSLLTQLAHISTDFVALKMDIHIWAKIAEHAAIELKAQKIDWEALEQWFTLAYNSAMFLRQILQNLHRRLNDIDPSFVSQEMPPTSLQGPTTTTGHKPYEGIVDSKNHHDAQEPLLIIKIEHPDPSELPLKLKEAYLDREEWQRSNPEY
jgi:hypothetical protein